MVASRSLASDPSGDVLALAADDAEIDGDGVDATRLAFRAVDRYGAPRPYVTGQVTLDIEGPAVLIGDNPFDFAASGGVGAAWIRSRPARRVPSPSAPATPAWAARSRPSGSAGRGSWKPAPARWLIHADSRAGSSACSRGRSYGTTAQD